MTLDLNQRGRGRPRIMIDEELLKIIMEECWKTSSPEVSQLRLRQITKLKKSTLSIMIKQLREQGWIRTRKIRQGKFTYSLAFTRRFVTDISKIKNLKGAVGHSTLSIEKDHPIRVFGQMSDEFELNSTIALRIKDHIRKYGGQEERVLEVIPKLHEKSKEELMQKTSDLNFQLDEVSKGYIKEEWGQEELVFEINSVTQYLEEMGIEGS